MVNLNVPIIWTHNDEVIGLRDHSAKLTHNKQRREEMKKKNICISNDVCVCVLKYVEANGDAFS